LRIQHCSTLIYPFSRPVTCEVSAIFVCQAAHVQRYFQEYSDSTAQSTYQPVRQTAAPFHAYSRAPVDDSKPALSACLSNRPISAPIHDVIYARRHTNKQLITYWLLQLYRRVNKQATAHSRESAGNEASETERGQTVVRQH